MEIGEKIKRLRQRLGLTQEELGARTELSKGFISQVERDITSPSIATLMDILEALGTDIGDFFMEKPAEKVVYSAEDMFEKEGDGRVIRWLVTSSQRDSMEPILVTLAPGASTEEDDPHEGEEFGYVLGGAVTLCHGEQRYRVRKGECFYLHPSAPHWVKNSGKTEARLLWVSTPPSF